MKSSQPPIDSTYGKEQFAGTFEMRKGINPMQFNRSFSCLICLLLLHLVSVVEAQSLERKLFNSGGDQALLGLNAYSYSFGEPMVGTDLSNLPSLTMGFHQPMQMTLLAVHHLNAQANWEQEDVFLSWSTDAFLMGSWFQVERSTDRQMFLPIGTLDQTPGNVYSFSDAEAQSLFRDRLYYRISWKNPDGLEIGSEILEVSRSTPSEDLIAFFPNPASEQVFVRLLQSDVKQLTISLYTSLGRLVLQKEISSPTASELYQIPTSDLTSGTFLLRFHTGQMQLIHRLLIDH